MSSAVVDNGVPVAETEAYHELVTRAGRRTGNIPVDLMVRQVMACVPAHEWPTRVEALEAVLRRLEAARKDSLRVEVRPADGRHFGLYVTRRPGAARGLIARSCSGLTRSRGVATALIFSRTRSACASTSWSCSGTFTAARASCNRPGKSRNGAILKRVWACAGTRSDRFWGLATGSIASSGKETSSPPRREQRGQPRPSSGFAPAGTASRA